MNTLNKIIKIKNLILIYFLLFFIGFFLSLMFLPESYDLSENITDISSFMDVFLYNLKVALVIIITGIFSVGLISSFIVFFNGLYFGYFFFSNMPFLEPLHFIALFIFHGPFEIVGLSIGYALSILIPWSIIKTIWKHDFQIKTGTARKFLIYYTFHILLLFISGIIEYFVITHYK
ncbi:stage II sporulation protein M [Melghiribacillus thermohalophilus]|uniref:Stage II sporulation protein M n=1 Tax=Melghiribacillus thermohalophilus TaxID=1324956 RepID=A0A4R3MX70_9BACI|nr:stage II sporulation protein M [Melghiribacillus thermohalophilus]